MGVGVEVHLPGVLKHTQKNKKLGGGGGRKISKFFFTTNFFFKNVPEVLKRMQFFFSEGGGFWGVWGAPRPHPGVARGRKTIHFFL